MSAPTDPEAPNLHLLREALEDVGQALDMLDTLARTLNLIDLPDISRATEALVATGRAIVAAHTPDPDDQVTRQLVTLNDRIDTLAIPSRDPKLGHSNTLRELQDAWGRVGVRLRNAIAAAKALGWEPGPAPRATAIVTRSEAAADLAEIATHLHGIEQHLRALRNVAENPPAPPEQRGIINVHIGKMTPEIKLGLIQAELGTAANLDTLSRIAEAVSTLTFRFQSWLASLQDRVTRPIRRAAEAVRSAVERMVGTIASAADITALRRATPDPQPRNRDVRPPDGFSLVRAHDMIQAGTAPPEDWAPFLTALDLSRRPLANIAPLAGLTSLQSLNLDSTQVTDLTALAALTSLQSLNLDSTQVTDLTPLAALTNLQSLNLAFTKVTDLTLLAALTNLQSLNLNGTKVADLTPLAPLTNLQSLALNGTQVADLTPLATLADLQSLDLGYMKLLPDLIPLTALTNLQTLNLSSTQVADLHPLAALANLRSLELWNTKVTDLSPLAALTNLQTLNLMDVPFTDIAPLAALDNLHSLTLSFTKVSDLTPLAGLPNLQSLNLGYTKVTDLSPVAGLPNLQSLNISNLPEGIEASLLNRAEINVIRR